MVKLHISFIGLATLAPIALAQTGLSTVARAAGKKYFGSATDNSELTDGPYVAQLSNTLDFNQITPVYMSLFTFADR